jgi:hypothetical protein
MFITAFTKDCHLCLARSVQSMTPPPHLTSRITLSPRHGASSKCGWRHDLQIWKVAANVLNLQSWTADNGWSSSLGLAYLLTTSHRKNLTTLLNGHLYWADIPESHNNAKRTTVVQQQRPTERWVWPLMTFIRTWAKFIGRVVTRIWQRYSNTVEGTFWDMTTQPLVIGLDRGRWSQRVCLKRR